MISSALSPAFSRPTFEDSLAIPGAGGGGGGGGGS